MVGSILVKLLERPGYDPVLCNIGATALDAYAENPSICDAIITDLSMPGMTGITLAQKLRSSGYAGPLVLATGRAESLDVSSIAVAGIDRVVEKPFTINEIVGTLERLLSSAESAD